MKTKSLILGIGIAISLFLISCNFSFDNFSGTKGNGNIVKEIRSVKSFNSIEAASAFNITVIKGDVQELLIETDDNLLEQIISKVEGDELILSTKGNINRPTKMNVTITIPELKEIDLSGACELISESRFENSKMELELSGASHADIKVKCEEIDIDMSGASKLNISGYASTQKIEASGACKIYSYDLESNKVDINCSGASTVKIFVKEAIHGDISGASNVYYKGNPKAVVVETSGAASVSEK